MGTDVVLTHADATSTAPRPGPVREAGHAALVADLDEHVRELVRREGVDPQLETGVVRRLAEGVVRRHDERSLTGAVAPVGDVDAVVGELVARVSGFGPLQPFLDDPSAQLGRVSANLVDVDNDTSTPRRCRRNLLAGFGPSGRRVED